MELKNGVITVYAESRKDWRNWLYKNHLTEKSVWLIIYKKRSGVKSVSYTEAVDEALCFGWIDSKPNKRDDKSYYQFFSRRNPKSNWSKVNKNKVTELIKKGLMTSAGIAVIKEAKLAGTWSALDEVEKLEIPKLMEKLFRDNKSALLNWQKFPRSVKRGILEWIHNAKKEETKIKRISETVNLAKQNIRANQYHGVRK
jgi:uncharacterized protein YdeI (YjbR/CyaY-like superfamily)